MKYSLRLQENRSKNKGELDTMLTITLWNKKEVNVVDFIFDEKANLKEINSEIDKKEVKKYMCKLIDDTDFYEYMVQNIGDIREGKSD